MWQHAPAPGENKNLHQAVFVRTLWSYLFERNRKISLLPILNYFRHVQYETFDRLALEPLRSRPVTDI